MKRTAAILAALVYLAAIVFPVAAEDGEIIVDLTSDQNVTLTGDWKKSETIKNYNGSYHLWNATYGDGFQVTFKDLEAGNYKVYYWKAVHSNSTSQMRFTLFHNGTETELPALNLQTGETGWELLGIYDFSGTGDESLVHEIWTDNSRATAVKLVPTTEPVSQPVAEEPDVPKVEDGDLVDVEPVDGFSFEGDWQFSGALPGPMVRKPGSMWVSGPSGATATYDPDIKASGMVRISVYKLWWPEGQDPKVRYDIVHNGKTDTKYLDTSAGTKSEWVELGEFDFSGTGDEYVRLTRETSKQGINTRAGTVRFDIINSQNGEIWQSIYVTPNTQLLDRKSLAELDQFLDLTQHWACYDVEYMAALGLIHGKSEDQFAPDDLITRAEFTTILVRGLNLEEHEPEYQDVTQEDWFYQDVGKAQGAGILEGLPGGELFLPDEAITRQEIALLLSNAVTSLGREPQWRQDKEISFSDWDSAAAWAKDALDLAVDVGILKGDDSNCIRPGDCASRAESAVMLKRFLEAFVWSGPPSGQEWEIAFADEFEGDSLDWNTWISQNGPSSHILSSRWKENVAVEDGLLKLITKKETRAGQDWTTASVWVDPTVFSQKYGYWEARYRYAPVSGINNAWWMMTQSGNKQTPQSFEIDINEGHYQNVINMTYHTGLDQNGEASSNSARYVSEFDLSQDFHTYGLEWTETELIYYFDGKEIERKTHVNSHLPVTPWLSTAVLNWAGTIGDEADGTSMDVDWVRVYRKK